MSLGGRGRVFTRHVHDPEDRSGRVPLLPESGLRPGVSGTAQLPVDVEPVWIANHGDDSVLDAGMVECPGGHDRQWLGRGRQRGDRRSDARSPRSGIGSRRLGRLRSFFADGKHGKRPDQLILTHGMPADYPFILGQLGQILLVAVLERFDGHAEPLRLHPRALDRDQRGSDKERGGSSLSGPIRKAPCLPDFVIRLAGRLQGPRTLSPRKRSVLGRKMQKNGRHSV